MYGLQQTDGPIDKQRRIETISPLPVPAEQRSLAMIASLRLG